MDKPLKSAHGWRPPLYTPRSEYVWFDGQTSMPQPAIVVCPDRGRVHVYRVRSDGRIEWFKWRPDKALSTYWLGMAAMKKLKAAALVCETRALSVEAGERLPETAGHYRREARKAREKVRNLAELLQHLMVSIRRAIG